MGQKNIAFKIDADTWIAFKRYCLENQTNMTAVLVSFIESIAKKV